MDKQFEELGISPFSSYGDVVSAYRRISQDLASTVYNRTPGEEDPNDLEKSRRVNLAFAELKNYMLHGELPKGQRFVPHEVIPKNYIDEELQIRKHAGNGMHLTSGDLVDWVLSAEFLDPDRTPKILESLRRVDGPTYNEFIATMIRGLPVTRTAVEVLIAGGFIGLVTFPSTVRLLQALLPHLTADFPTDEIMAKGADFSRNFQNDYMTRGHGPPGIEIAEAYFLAAFIHELIGVQTQFISDQVAKNPRLKLAFYDLDKTSTYTSSPWRNFIPHLSRHLVLLFHKTYPPPNYSPSLFHAVSLLERDENFIRGLGQREISSIYGHDLQQSQMGKNDTLIEMLYHTFVSGRNDNGDLMFPYAVGLGALNTDALFNAREDVPVLFLQNITGALNVNGRSALNNDGIIKNLIQWPGFPTWAHAKTALTIWLSHGRHDPIHLLLKKRTFAISLVGQEFMHWLVMNHALAGSASWEELPRQSYKDNLAKELMSRNELLNLLGQPPWVDQPLTNERIALLSQSPYHRMTQPLTCINYRRNYKAYHKVLTEAARQACSSLLVRTDSPAQQ